MRSLLNKKQEVADNQHLFQSLFVKYNYHQLSGVSCKKRKENLNMLLLDHDSTFIYILNALISSFVSLITLSSGHSSDKGET